MDFKEGKFYEATFELQKEMKRLACNDLSDAAVRDLCVLVDICLSTVTPFWRKIFLSLCTTEIEAMGDNLFEDVEDYRIHVQESPNPYKSPNVKSG